MKSWTETVRAWLLSAIVVLVLCWMAHSLHVYCAEHQAETKMQKIPQIEEIQRLIGCEKIDGRLGPETQQKWDRAICDQFGVEALLRQGWHE